MEGADEAGVGASEALQESSVIAAPSTKSEVDLPEAYKPWERVPTRPLIRNTTEESERRRRMEESEQRRRIEKPWQYETDNPMTDPPDINHRETIISDQDAINRLLNPKNDVNFEERCLRYVAMDLDLEQEILREYLSWVRSMTADAGRKTLVTRDRKRHKFFFELMTVVQKDYNELVQEYDEASDPRVVYQPQRRRVAKELGIPYDRDEWATSDKRRYVSYGRWIPGWGSPSKALKQICEDQPESVDTADDAKQQNGRGRTSLAPTEDGHHNRTELKAEQLEKSDYALPSADHLGLKEVENVNTSPHTKSESNPPVIEASLLHETQTLKFPPDASQPYFRIFALLLLSVLFHGLLKQALQL